MNRARRSDTLERLAGDPDRVNAYDRATEMLDRLGLVYVCRHPEILLGKPPSIAFVAPADKTYGGVVYDPLCGYASNLKAERKPGVLDDIAWFQAYGSGYRT